MGTNDEYFASLAQLILATAASQKAEQDRKDELAFRRQQAAESLALQREGLALEGRRTDAQIKADEARQRATERGDVRDEERYRRDVEKQEQEDAEIEAAAALATNPGAYIGAKPAEESVGGKVQLRALKMRSEAAKAKDEEAAALEGPADRAFKRKVDESSLKASESSRAFTETQRAEFAAGAEHRRKMEELQIATAEKQNRGLDIDLSLKQRAAEQSMRDSIARRFGQMTPDDRAALDLGFKKLKMESMFQAAEKAAMDPVTGTFNPDVYSKEVAKIESAANMAGGLGLLSKRDPAQFKELQASAAKAAMDIIGSGGSPSVAFDAVRSMVDTVVKATKPKPSPADTPKPKVGEELMRRMGESKAKNNAVMEATVAQTKKHASNDQLVRISNLAGDMDEGKFLLPYIRQVIDEHQRNGFYPSKRERDLIEDALRVAEQARSAPRFRD